MKTHGNAKTRVARPAGATVQILIVDDDENFRPALKKVVERAGYEVTAAANGAEAWQLLHERIFDLVISDIRMPEMDGIELTRRIKKGPRPIPVILITGFSDILETHEAYALGANEFLTKPIVREELEDAIHRCLGDEEKHTLETTDDSSFCRLGIDDFTSGRQIQFNIFIRLAPDKYIKIAHQGEDLSIERVRAYKSKGVRHLHMKRGDFRTYVGFSVSLTRAVKGAKEISRQKKLNLLKHTGEVLLEQVQQEGVDQDSFDAAVTFVQTTVDVLCESPDVLALLEVLNQHADHLYAHSVGVSLYSVMLAQAVEWSLPTNKFKVAVGGLLHDIGEKELDRGLLKRPRKEWSIEEIRLYESHPVRGVEILGTIQAIPADVLQIVKEHHENCMAQGFPNRIRRGSIHPMAKLVAVANEFCDRVIGGPNGPGLPPDEALQQMYLFCSERLEPQFLNALMRLFKFSPAVPGHARGQRMGMRG